MRATMSVGELSPEAVRRAQRRRAGPRVAHHGQPSRAVLGSWETTRGPEGVDINRRPLSGKADNIARSELFRF